MIIRIYMFLQTPVQMYYEDYLQNHFPDYNIISLNKEDLALLPTPMEKEATGDFPWEKAPPKRAEAALVLCDSDAILDKLTEMSENKAHGASLPRIAVSHAHNTGESLMKAPWLIDSPLALTPEFLNKVICRHDHLPLPILSTAHYRLRELTMGDLGMLCHLQIENQDNPAGCFFPEEVCRCRIRQKESPGIGSGDSPTDIKRLNRNYAARFLQNYIDHQYPFYEYGFYAIEPLGEGQTITGIAGFYLSEGEKSNPHRTSDGRIEVGYALLKKHQGKGILLEVLPALLQYGRQTLGFDQITVSIAEENTASIRLAKATGLV